MAVEALVKGAWIVLAAIHVFPAAVLVAPELTTRLYGVEADGPAGLLLVHRGALFLAVVAAALFAAFDPAARRACSVVVGISVLGFLAVYVRAGLPAGALRPIAVADTAALLPLALAAMSAWRR
ncbi:MAG TPA: hypothetical protein VEH84_16115 [Alphaproteobacteria bacterium]|nr:hypothetical protein [Alphaproteobacteria bacterium]